jgi:hypothetical protein
MQDPKMKQTKLAISSTARPQTATVFATLCFLEGRWRIMMGD